MTRPKSIPHRAMRCLYLLSSEQIGGGNKSLLTLWQAATRLGVEPVAVCPAPGPMLELTRASGVHCEVFEYRDISLRRPLGFWKNHRSWKRVIARLRPDLVHANCIDTARSITYTCARRRLPLICHVRFPRGRECLSWVFRRLPVPCRFIFNSYALHDQIRPDLDRFYPGAEHTVVHNAVDLNQFRRTVLPRSSPFRVGIIGNFMPVKGHEDFLRMAADIASRGRETEFWIIGDDIHGAGRRAALEGMATDLGLTDSVKFLGHRLDIPELLRELHVVVCPSLEEPFGRVLIEAMACGRPVIATRVGGIPEVVEENRSGFLVERGDYRAMAAKVAHLMDHREDLEALSSRACELVRERFSMDRHAERILSVYHEVLGVGGPESEPRPAERPVEKQL